MSLTDFPDLARLPKRKRMQLADELWLSGVDDKTKVPAWHRDILDQRWAAYKSGQVKSISLEELERRLAKS